MGARPLSERPLARKLVLSLETDSLLAGLTRRPPAAPDALERLVLQAGVELPAAYLRFLAFSDGGEGDIGEQWLEIWPVGRVLAELEAGPRYEDVVLFASDGANTVFGFDRSRGGDVVEGDWVGLERDDVIRYGSFTEFLRVLARGRGA